MRQRLLSATVALVAAAAVTTTLVRHPERSLAGATARGLGRPSTGAVAVRGRVDRYATVSALVPRSDGRPPRVAIRSMTVSGRDYFTVVDPETLLTTLARAEDVRIERLDAPALSARLAGTTYARALEDGRRGEGALSDAGVTHLRAEQPGISLTVDLCPSARPLDRGLFTTLLRQLERVEQPVPVAIAVTGVWMRDHAADLDWLATLDRTGQLAVTWVNHSFHHFTSRTRPLSSNFLLEPGTDVRDEVLATERVLIEQGLVPSIFFRFPGLVSSRALVETVVSYGLVPIGSDAWLAKGEWPSDGSIVLVHGNGNEPLGVKRFVDLLARKTPAVHEHRWLLLDLRASLVNTERTAGR